MLSDFFISIITPKKHRTLKMEPPKYFHCVCVCFADSLRLAGGVMATFVVVVVGFCCWNIDFQEIYSHTHKCNGIPILRIGSTSDFTLFATLTHVYCIGALATLPNPLPTLRRPVMHHPTTHNVFILIYKVKCGVLENRILCRSHISVSSAKELFKYEVVCLFMLSF